ncbi:MAG: diguanylate cyclase [Ideonella sp.]|nr:diguanylate cyclase [Ideonella sp.]
MRSRSLHTRFQTAVLLVAVALAAVVSIFVYRTARLHYLATGEASARSIASAVEQTVAVGVYARDEVLLKELMAGLARHPSVARIAVSDSNGNQMATASSKVTSGGAAASAAAASQAPPSFESVLGSPFNPAETVGRLQVWLDAARLSNEARNQAAMLVGAIIVLLTGVLMVFNALASRLLSKPMHELAEQLTQIEPGTSMRLGITKQHEGDEVGVVTTAANLLLDLQQQALERERAMRDEIAVMEARYRGIFASTSAGIFIMSSHGRLLQANPALGRLLGMSAGDIERSPLFEFSSKSFRDPSQLAELVQLARASSQPEDRDLELVRSDGRAVWVHCMVSVIADESSGDHRVEGVLYDITQRKLQERSAQHRAEHDALTGLKSRAYIESSLDQHLHSAQSAGGAVTLMFIDLDGFKGVNDRWGHAAGDAVLIEVARRLRTLFMRGSDIVGRLGGDELVVMMEGLDALHPAVADMATQLIQSFKMPFLLPNGETAQVGASVGVASYPRHATSAETLIHAADAAMYAVKQSGKGGFVIAHSSMGAAREAARPTAARDDLPMAPAGAMCDPLTGLPDRRQLGERLAAAHGLVAAGGGMAAVICVDLDQFKSVNVAHGSQVGDHVLREVAHRLSNNLRRTDLVARTGSDEFVLVVMTERDDVLEATRAVDATARKLLGALAQPIKMGNLTLALQASVGVSFIDGNLADPEEVLRESQLALRRSKSSGRNSLVFFERKMMDGFQDQLELEEDLRAAIGSEQFFLQVQPQVGRDGVGVGGEALLRWSHPERGLVPPDQFIPLAETCGAIVDLGSWVLSAGCAILARMHAAGNLQTLSINISPKQFNDAGFVSRVREALEMSGAPPGGLILEITENLLISDVAGVAARLTELVSLGVRFSIDDFGTGFSSLSYLQQLPLYEIKIDRSFTAGLPQDAASVGIVRSILSMGSHLDLNVVAEGVETAEMSSFLHAHGCPVQQGWFHGRPKDVEQFLGSLKTEARQGDSEEPTTLLAEVETTADIALS